jgi:transposase
VVGVSFTDTLLKSLRERRLFIKLGTTNGRLGIDSLSAYAMGTDSDAVLEGAVFAFCSKMHNQVRLLLWDEGGYWLLQRKIYNGYFIWPESYEDAQAVEACYEQLRILLKDTRSLKRAMKKTCNQLEEAGRKSI